GKVAAELRRNLYAGDMSLAQQALAEENRDRALALLEAYRPAPGEEDLRTFEWRYRWEQCRDRSHWTLTVPGAATSSAEFSPDGKLLAVACTDPKVRFYDAATHPECSPPIPLAGEPRFLTFSPDGRMLAVHCDNDTVFLCDVAACRVLNRFSSPRSDCGSLAFSPDGRILAAPAADGNVQL